MKPNEIEIRLRASVERDPVRQSYVMTVTGRIVGRPKSEDLLLKIDLFDYIIEQQFHGDLDHSMDFLHRTALKRVLNDVLDKWIKSDKKKAPFIFR